MVEVGGWARVELGDATKGRRVYGSQQVAIAGWEDASRNTTVAIQDLGCKRAGKNTG